MSGWIVRGERKIRTGSTYRTCTIYSHHVSKSIYIRTVHVYSISHKKVKVPYRTRTAPVQYLERT